MKKYYLVFIFAALFACSAFSLTKPPSVFPPSVVMNCPAPESIHYENGLFSAPVTLPGWEGQWVSQKHEKSEVKSFVSALFFARGGAKEGVLVNGTYLLSSGEEIDLTWEPKNHKHNLVNLIVSIEGYQGWHKESDVAGIQGYACTGAAPECRFTPVRVADN